MRTGSSRYSRYFTYIKPVIKSPIIKTYGTAIFTILIMIIFILFAIKPTIETIVVLQKKLDDSEVTLNQLKKKAENLTLGKQNLEGLDPTIKNRIETAVPDSVDLKSLIQILELAARENSASISALQIQPIILDTKTEASVGILGELAFTFNLEGSYEQLTSLLQDLKTSVRLLSIDSLSISKVSDEIGQSLIMSISGKVYFIK